MCVCVCVCVFVRVCVHICLCVYCNIFSGRFTTIIIIKNRENNSYIMDHCIYRLKTELTPNNLMTAYIYQYLL